jgi:hypothetical protein
MSHVSPFHPGRVSPGSPQRVSNVMERPEASISPGWRTGANGVVESWDGRGCASVPNPNQPSRPMGESGRRVRCRCCRLRPGIGIMGSIACRSSPNRARLQRHRMSFELSAILMRGGGRGHSLQCRGPPPFTPFSRCVRPGCPRRRLCDLPRQETMPCGAGACVTLSGTPPMIVGGIWPLRH